MVANTISTFLSLTVHCARCHNHKFDPITQEDYYRLQAVFAGVDRADRAYDPDAKVAARRRELAEQKQHWEVRRERLLEAASQAETPEIAALDRQAAELQEQLAASDDKTLPPSGTLGYHSQIMPRPQATKWVQVDLGKSVSLDQVVLVPSHVVYGGHKGPGFGFPPRFKVEVVGRSAVRRLDLAGR